MGRNRKPLELHKLQGTWRADRHGSPLGDSEERNLPVKPEGLSSDASRFWDQLTILLAKILRESDGPQLREMCEWYADIGRIRAKMQKTLPGSDAFTRLIKQAALARQNFDSIAKRFALTPSDRAALHAEQTTPQKAKVATRPKTKLDGKGKPAK